MFESTHYLGMPDGTRLAYHVEPSVAHKRGIMLISHEINYAMEHGGGQFGLSAQRKLGEGATHQKRIVDLAKRLGEIAARQCHEPNSHIVYWRYNTLRHEVQGHKTRGRSLRNGRWRDAVKQPARRIRRCGCG